MKKYSTPLCELTGIDTKDIMQASYELFREATGIENGDLDNDTNIDFINWQK